MELTATHNNNPSEARDLLKYTADLIDVRYQMLARVEKKNRNEYNNWVLKYPEEAKALGLQILPKVHVYINKDEYSTADCGEKIESVISRLSIKGYSCGVRLHLLP